MSLLQKIQLATILLAFSSCRKEYTCYCEHKTLGAKDRSEIHTRVEYKEEDAEEWCNSLSEQTDVLIFTISEKTCSLQ